MKNTSKIMVVTLLISIASLVFATNLFAASPPSFEGMVLAPLKTAQPYEWSAPNEFFTGNESANVKYNYEASSFGGVVELKGFRQAGPYVFTVDTADATTFAGYGCDLWVPWAELYGETFPGGINGCWNGVPYADIKLFYLEQYDSNGDGESTGEDYYGGLIPFDVPLLEGTYNLKFFIKLDWRLTGIYSNIMMMNDMTGDPKYGKVTIPRKGFNYDEDLKIIDGLAGENLVLAETAWCQPSCQPPSSDPGYQGTSGVVFYWKLADTFTGIVMLSQTVEPPISQPLQIKLEGMGSLSEDLESNEWIGYIGRWWDNNVNDNITDAQYLTVKESHDVLGYVIFDGFDTSTVSKDFALDSSYHTLWTPQPDREAPGSVVMTEGYYKAYFALTENTKWWRGVFLSENPLEFTIQHQ